MSYDAFFADLESPSLRGAATTGLSLEQQTALEAPADSDAVICAGAGAGKTKLLVERAARLVNAGADPATVAVVTFTRKAANEIEARLKARFADKSKVPVCATVHSLALSRLRAQGRTIHIARDEQVLAHVARLREMLPDDYLSLSDAEILLDLNRAREEEASSSTAGLFAMQLAEYLAEDELTDFTSLMVLAADELRPHFKHILVDEAQDLSKLQQSVLNRLGHPGCRYWYIGDDDQSIYAFRGSEAGVMQQLSKRCPATYVLSTNFRSARSVIAHANNVIRFNPGRMAIEWAPHRRDEGSVAVTPFRHGDDELAAVELWLRAGSGRAVLSRTQALIEPLRQLGLKAVTVHESKGLEWDDVWVLGCEAALFPHPLGLREEERRLFYVAMTRARNNLRLSYCETRSTKNPLTATRHASPFLYETQALERRG